MSKKDLVRKLTSRKLWLSVAEFVAMLMVAFGATDNQAAQVVALIMAGAGVIAYVIAEGLTDASSVQLDGELIDSITIEGTEEQ